MSTPSDSQDGDVDPIGWMAVPDKHPVLAEDGEHVAYVAARLGDVRNGRFDGFVIGIDVKLQLDPRLMLEVDQVGDITIEAVHTQLSADAIRALPPYEPDRAWKPRLQQRKR